MKYKYMLVNDLDLSIAARRQKKFNQLGEWGWEYCGPDSYGYYVFKMKVDEDTSLRCDHCEGEVYQGVNDYYFHKETGSRSCIVKMAEVNGETKV